MVRQEELAGMAPVSLRDWSMKDCAWCNGPCRMPGWVIDGWYTNNADKQRLAVANWHAKAMAFAKSKGFVGVSWDKALRPGSFFCDEPTPCRGVELYGLVYHTHACAWWHRPENRERTPF